MTVPAGSLRQRITIQQATSTEDAAGQPIPTWSTYRAGVPARVDQVTGGETMRGHQVSAQTTALLTIRYLSGVTSRMRVAYEGKTLGILRVSDPDGTRREMRIECREAL